MTDDEEEVDGFRIEVRITEDPDADPGDVRFVIDSEGAGDHHARIVREEFVGHPYHSWMYQDAFPIPTVDHLEELRDAIDGWIEHNREDA